MTIKKYDNTFRDIWNKFIECSRNGTFLFHRDYMEYHSDRFIDHSLIIFDDGGEILALLPGNIKDSEYYSHGGLTYGGFIINERMTTPKMLEVFTDVIKYLKANSVSKFYYKTIPYIYNSLPSEEDRYALFLNHGELYRRDVLTIIPSKNKLKYQERRLRNLKKAQKNELAVSPSDDFQQFWNILEKNLLSVHNTKPVHSVEEIILLKNKFDNNIKLFCSYKNNTMVAGVVIYESQQVAHIQYIANSEEGRNIGGLDIIFDFLIQDYYKDKPYFDFGISNEQNGLFLNQGLIDQKEGFGARAVVHDYYQLILS